MPLFRSHRNREAIKEGQDFEKKTCHLSRKRDVERDLTNGKHFELFVFLL